MNYKCNKSYFIIIATMIMFTFHCTGELVLSELVNNRISFILHGTYESNSPHAQADIYVDDGVIALATSSTTGGSAMNLAESTSPSNLSVKFYLDIAEIRIATGTGLSANAEPLDYFQYIARTRKLFCSDASARYGKSLETCIEQSGGLQLRQLMSSGYYYPASDIPAQHIYRHIAIYMRRLVTSPSSGYNTAGTKLKDYVSEFDNREVNGFNIEPLYRYAPSDVSTTTPRLFPLERTDLSLYVRKDDYPYNLEVRVFLKNLWMKHAVSNLSTTATSLDTSNAFFIGPSDWQANHAYNNNANAGKLGKNFILTARIWRPHVVGHLNITSLPASSTNTGLNYIAVVPAGQTLSATEIPFTATSVPATGGSVTVTNLEAGSYDVYRTCDKIKNVGVAGQSTSDQDGFPETIIACAAGSAAGISTGATTIINGTACGCN